MAFDHGPIGLGDLAVLEQKPQMSKRLAVPPQHQASRGVLVEAVGERGRARQAVAQGVEMVLEAGAALRAAMHRHPCGLVDDQHQAVAVEHTGLHRFRAHRSRRQVFKRGVFEQRAFK
jgi:hypothetical protein